MHRPSPLIAAAAALAVLGLSPVAAPVLAVASDDASPVAAPGWTAQTHHDYARRSLLRGRSFARAALHLEEATRLDPTNPEHRLLLGCAHASRAASLAYARGMNRYRVDEIESYPERLREWEEEEKERKERGSGFEMPRPPEPPAAPFPVKDDGKPYTLTAEAFRAEWDRHHAAALSAWGEAVKLSRTPEQQARAGYVRGWGMWILHTYAEVAGWGADGGNEEDGAESAPVTKDDEDDEPEDPKKQAERRAAEEVILAAFEAAVGLVPDDAGYWESFGEFLRLHPQAAAKPRPDGKPRPTAREAHLTALRLNPKNAPLWCLLGLEERPTSSDATDTKSVEKRKKALEFFERAAKADPADSRALYYIAAVHFAPTPFQNLMFGGKAVADMPHFAPEKMMAKGRLPENRAAARLGLDALVRANLRPAPPRPLRYRPPVPEELSAAWAYVGDMAYILLDNSFAIRSLARNAAGYARFLAREGKDPAQARRAADAVMTLGARLLGDWPLRDRERHDGSAINVMVGQSVAEYGYRAQIEVLRAAEDEAGAERVQAEHAAFRERQRAWMMVFQGTLHTTTLDDY